MCGMQVLVVCNEEKGRSYTVFVGIPCTVLYCTRKVNK